MSLYSLVSSFSPSTLQGLFILCLPLPGRRPRVETDDTVAAGLQRNLHSLHAEVFRILAQPAYRSDISQTFTALNTVVFQPCTDMHTVVFQPCTDMHTVVFQTFTALHTVVFQTFTALHTVVFQRLEVPLSGGLGRG